MWLHVNKKTKMIEGYTQFSLEEPLPNEGCELVQADEIPEDWNYCFYIDGQIVADEAYKESKLLDERRAEIRMEREIRCFSIINRGIFWYNMLSEEQRSQLQKWYQAWLDAPATRIIPDDLAWINNSCDV